MNNYYKNTHLDRKLHQEKLDAILAIILQEFKENPRDILTIPEISLGSIYLHISSDGERIILTESEELPCLVVPEPYVLNNNNLARMYNIYCAIKQGFTFRICPDLETEVWVNILNHLNISIS